MRRKYTPWIVALSLAASLPLAATGSETSADVADASLLATAEDTDGGENSVSDYSENGVDSPQDDNQSAENSGEGETLPPAQEEQPEPVEEQQQPASEQEQPSAPEQSESSAPQQTEPSAPEQTEPATQAPTEPPATEPATDAPAEPDTQKSTEPATQAPTEPEPITPVEPVTEPPLEPEPEPATEPETLPQETLLEDEEFDPERSDEEEVNESSVQGGTSGNVREHDETETETETERIRGGNVSDGGAGELYIAVHGYPVGDLTKNERRIYRYLREELGLNKAAACGVLSNMYFESNFSSIAIGDGGTSLGLCQWHLGRCRALMSWCEAHDLDFRSVDGQLAYLSYELENAYSGVLGYLYGVPDNAEGAYRAGYYFCMYFESPDSVRVRSDARGTYAKVTYYPSDLDRYLRETDSGKEYGLEGQVDRVLNATDAWSEALLEDSYLIPEDPGLAVQDVILEEFEEETEPETAAGDAIAALITQGTEEKQETDDTNPEKTEPDHAGAGVSVILIQSDASKPGTWTEPAAESGFGPKAQAW